MNLPKNLDPDSLANYLRTLKEEMELHEAIKTHVEEIVTAQSAKTQADKDIKRAHAHLLRLFARHERAI